MWTTFDAMVRSVTYQKSATSHDITVPVGSPYLDLDYIGWTVAAVVDVAGIPVSTLEPQSPPNTIFFNGNDDIRVHSFSVA